MNSYTTLLLIVAIQVAVIGILAFLIDRWIKKQPDKLLAKYKAINVIFKISILAFTFECFRVLSTYISDHHFSLSSLPTLLIVITILQLTKRRLINQIEEKRQIQTEQDAAANP